eukprot:2443569-Pleurochrysis_carterae.AAC.2
MKEASKLRVRCKESDRPLSTVDWLSASSVQGQALTHLVRERVSVRDTLRSHLREVNHPTSCPASSKGPGARSHTG